MYFILPQSGTRAQFCVDSFYQSRGVDISLGNNWIEFSKSENFLHTINKCLLDHLYWYVDLQLQDYIVELKRSKTEQNVIVVYADDNCWCELAITRHGFCVRGEPVEDIFLINAASFKTAW